MANDRPTDDNAQHDDAAKPGAAPRRGDKRDLEIERLERALADERANAVSLRESSDALRFQLEILERSYAKQLADARQRVDKPTKELAELKAQMAQFGLGGEDVAKILSELRADLLNVRAERNHLREQLGRPDASRGGSYGGRSNEQTSGDDTSDTINAMDDVYQYKGYQNALNDLKSEDSQAAQDSSTPDARQIGRSGGNG